MQCNKKISIYWLNIKYYFERNNSDIFPIKIDEDKLVSNLFEFVDVILVIGGDGSFIHAAKDAATHKKPVLCVNAGNLAFLAGLEGNELGLIENLITGELFFVPMEFFYNENKELLNNKYFSSSLAIDGKEKTKHKTKPYVRKAFNLSCHNTQIVIYWNKRRETMIIIITGPSHTGKTALAQRLLEKYNDFKSFKFQNKLNIIFKLKNRKVGICDGGCRMTYADFLLMI